MPVWIQHLLWLLSQPGFWASAFACIAILIVWLLATRRAIGGGRNRGLAMIASVLIGLAVILVVATMPLRYAAFRDGTVAIPAAHP